MRRVEKKFRCYMLFMHMFFLFSCYDQGKQEREGNAYKEESVPDMPSDFVCYSGINNNAIGVDYLEVNSSGSGRYVFLSAFDSNGMEIYKELRFHLEMERIGELWASIVAADFYTRKDNYRGNIHDGTQRYLRVKSNGRDKTIIFDNLFPDWAKDIFENEQAILSFTDKKKAVPVSKDEYTLNLPF